MKLAVIQNEPVLGRVEENLQAISQALSDAATADVAVLPELCTTGYAFKDARELESMAEPVPDGPSCRLLADLSVRHGLFICAGLLEAEGERFFNDAVLFGPLGFIARHRKVHLFDREKEMFTPGDEPFAVHDIGFARVGMMVCFDWIFPESARTLALRGAQVILHPANLVLPYCYEAMKTRALENRVFTVTVNRIGEERGLSFTGNSVVWSPRAERLIQGSDSTGVWFTEFNPTEADDKNMTDRNHLFGDRRPEFYE